MKERIEVLNTKKAEIGNKIYLHPLSGITVGMHKFNISIGSSDSAWMEIGNNIIQINCDNGYAGVIIATRKINFLGYIENQFIFTED